MHRHAGLARCDVNVYYNHIQFYVLRRGSGRRHELHAHQSRGLPMPALHPSPHSPHIAWQGIVHYGARMAVAAPVVPTAADTPCTHRRCALQLHRSSTLAGTPHACAQRWRRMRRTAITYVKLHRNNDASKTGGWRRWSATSLPRPLLHRFLAPLPRHATRSTASRRLRRHRQRPRRPRHDNRVGAVRVVLAPPARHRKAHPRVQPLRGAVACAHLQRRVKALGSERGGGRSRGHGAR